MELVTDDLGNPIQEGDIVWVWREGFRTKVTETFSHKKDGKYVTTDNWEWDHALSYDAIGDEEDEF